MGWVSGLDVPGIGAAVRTTVLDEDTASRLIASDHIEWPWVVVLVQMRNIELDWNKRHFKRGIIGAHTSPGGGDAELNGA